MMAFKSSLSQDLQIYPCPIVFFNSQISKEILHSFMNFPNLFGVGLFEFSIKWNIARTLSATRYLPYISHVLKEWTKKYSGLFWSVSLLFLVWVPQISLSLMVGYVSWWSMFVLSSSLSWEYFGSNLWSKMSLTLVHSRFALKSSLCVSSCFLFKLFANPLILCQTVTWWHQIVSWAI